MKKVEIIEIWKECDEDDYEATAFNFGNGKNLKNVAIIANGVPIMLKDTYLLERKTITEEEYKEYKTPFIGK